MLPESETPLGKLSSSMGVAKAPPVKRATQTWLLKSDPPSTLGTGCSQIAKPLPFGSKATVGTRSPASVAYITIVLLDQAPPGRRRLLHRMNWLLLSRAKSFSTQTASAVPLLLTASLASKDGTVDSVVIGPHPPPATE